MFNVLIKPVMSPFISSAKRASDTDRSILEVVKEVRGVNHATECELGRRMFTQWHCGRRMRQVKVFIDGARGLDEVVCPVCLHHYTLVSTSYTASDS